MTRFLKTGAFALATAALATLAVAQQDPLAAAVNARKAHMSLYAFNLGTLGAMAQGGMEYDAAAATAAANNIVALTSLDQMAYWLPGTAAGEVEGSRALPVMWDSIDDVIGKAMALNTAAVAMAEAAGTDLASLQAAMGALGGACGACHEAYRQAN